MMSLEEFIERLERDGEEAANAAYDRQFKREVFLYVVGGLLAFALAFSL